MSTKKNLFVILATVLMMFCAFSISASASDEEVLVMLNGDILEFDVQPQIINGRTMVPMRKIFESMGAGVAWEDSTQTITATKQNTTVVMQINNNVMLVNGNPTILDVPPQLVDSRTLVPVRAIAESFDIDVIWDEVTWTVMLSTYIPFDSPKQTFDYLCAWLLENGKTFANYTYIGWELDDGVWLTVRCYPDAVNGQMAIRVVLDTYDIDGVITSLGLFPISNNTELYATYDSLGDTFHINGEINMAMHTNSYPITRIDCEITGTESELYILEDTRNRINYLLDETAIILSAYNTQVTLKTLGFDKY